VRRTKPQHRRRQHQADRAVEPEDEPPVAERQHDCPVERPEDAAELLHGAHDAERQPSTLRRPEVGDERKSGRDQATTADALDQPAEHDALEVVGRGGDQGPDGEHHERSQQHRDAAAQVGDAADQWQHPDVAQQEARHDRCGALQLVEVEARRGHHVGQREHHDVRVGGRERDRDGCQPQEDLRGGADGLP
jgi:hypothetical protein